MTRDEQHRERQDDSAFDPLSNSNAQHGADNVESRPTSRYGSRLVQCVFRAFTPSFLQSHDTDAKQHEAARSTAWLDGLRGVCAWIVFNTHLLPILAKWEGFGWGADDGNRRVLQLPILALLYNGYFAVAMFFIISGYALSLQAVKYVHRPQGSHQSLARYSLSATLRRPFRLLIPSWASTLLPLLLISTGLLALAQDVNESSEVLDGRIEQFTSLAARQSSFLAQVWDLIKEDAKLLMLWNVTYARSDYNLVLWTIVTELRGSLMLYVFHIGLPYLKRSSLRITAALVLLIAFLAAEMMEMPMFLIGYLLCELDYRHADAAADASAPLVAWYAALFLLGPFLGSMPGIAADQSPFYAAFMRFHPLRTLPAQFFWQSVGAALTFLAVARTPRVQRLFASRALRYLGKVSFSLYLVHYILVAVLGTFAFDGVWSMTGRASGVAAAAGFVVAYALTLLPVLYVADVFCQLVDEPAVRIARAVDRLVLGRLDRADGRGAAKDVAYVPVVPMGDV